MKSLALLMVLMLQGCGAYQVIESPFVPYVKTFEGVYGQPVAINITFTGSLEATLNGVCLDNGDIQVSKSFWAAASDTEKEMLIFHELGHCVLHRPHDQSLNKEGYPNSYMFNGTVPELHYPQRPWPEYMAKHQKEYRAEMVGMVVK